MWCYTSELQQKLYTKLIECDEIRNVIFEGKETKMLMWLLKLKQICDHPRLLSQVTWKDLDIRHSENEEDNKTLIQQSGKLRFIAELLKYNKKEKTLVFSRSKKILNIIKKYIEDELNVPLLMEEFHHSECEHET